MDAGLLDFVHGLGAQPCWSQRSDDSAVFESGRLEFKDVGHRDDISFHPLDL